MDLRGSVLAADLSAEEREFLTQVEHFVDEEVRARIPEFEPDAVYPTELVQRMRELGLFGLAVPATYGGRGASALLCGAIYEEIGSAWVALCDILSPHFAAVRILVQHGTEAQRETYLPRMASGDLISSIALTEPQAGSDLRGIQTTATVEGDTVRLSGIKTMISHTINGSMALVIARLVGDPRHDTAVVILEAGDRGVIKTGDIQKLGHRGVELGELILQDVVLPPERIVGDGTRSGTAQTLSTLDAGRTWVAAGALGMARRALELALAYAQERIAFDQHLSEMPVVRQHISEMWVRTLGAELLVLRACTLLDGSAPWQILSPVAAAAKIVASEAAQACAVRSMQLHGGYGYTRAFEIERVYRDAVATTIIEGSNDLLHEIIARRLT